MKLGAFSVSLAVKDIKTSHEFYKKIGFEDFHGDIEQNWIIMKNGDNTIGLFQGMLEKNTLTFNPGWDQFANKLDTFTDIREIQRHFKEQGLELESEAEESSEGPTHFIIKDPDGNPILIDQHV
jgi:catechol 2,3-dioxygenase-like lactoylglutathione lyase family enzyme